MGQGGLKSSLILGAIDAKLRYTGFDCKKSYVGREAVPIREVSDPKFFRGCCVHFETNETFPFAQVQCVKKNDAFFMVLLKLIVYKLQKCKNESECCIV